MVKKTFRRVVVGLYPTLSSLAKAPSGVIKQLIHLSLFLSLPIQPHYAVGGLGWWQQRGAGSAGCIGGDYLGQDTVGPPGGDPINCIMM